MKEVNLVEFWSVQQYSDGDVHVFLSKQKALNAVKKWEENLDRQLAAWVAGDRTVSDGICEVYNEPDVDGKLQRNVRLKPGCLPGTVMHYPAFSVESSQWNQAVGYELLKWGNPATARPVIPYGKQLGKRHSLNNPKVVKRR
ncbi:MAG TPA: hypothetical protein VIQ31_18385 [Phormidium sp.]